MKCTCGTNWIYALVREGMVRRLTFSRNLAEFIQDKNPDHSIMLLDLVVGESPESGKKGLFGIVDVRKGTLLRATVSREEADLLTRDQSRTVRQCFVKQTKNYRKTLCESI